MTRNVINNIDNFQKNLEINMKHCVNNFKININKIHVGRISSNILDAVMVEYYGKLISVSQITNSVIDQSQTLIVKVFDQNMIKPIERAIFSSNLGVTPIVRNNVIRIKFPDLTEDRRLFLIKMVRSESEKSKISVRNIRRVANDQVKIFLRNKEIGKDDEYHLQNVIQTLTNFWIKKIDLLLKEKELELMKF